MDMNEKNGQPSMEEILASIRRIIAEDPSEAVASAEQGAKSGSPAPGPVDDSLEFELPSIFRSQSGETQQKQAPRFNRLTDAIRGNQPEAKPGQADPQSQSGLSSLHATRPDGAVDVSHPVEGQDVLQQQASPATYTSSATPTPAGTSQENVKRVMAPFKDTRFAQMADSPAPSVSPVSSPLAAPMPQHEAPHATGVVQPVAQPAPYAGDPMGVSPPTSTVPPPLTQQVGSAGTAVGVPGYEAALNPGVGADAMTGNGSIEDATAELLRPMLRQWLTDNMPRMVEKALHIEVASSVNVPKKPSGL